MPIPKRWFPVSREIGDDPEVWELTDTFGDRALRTWLEVLAILDRTENSWKLAGHWLAGISRKTRQKPATVQREIDWLISKGWLVVAEHSVKEPPLILTSPNYFKYRKRRESNGAASGPEQGPSKDPEAVPSEPTQSEPTLPKDRGERIRGDARGEKENTLTLARAEVREVSLR